MGLSLAGNGTPISPIRQAGILDNCTTVEREYFDCSCAKLMLNCHFITFLPLKDIRSFKASYVLRLFDVYYIT